MLQKNISVINAYRAIGILLVMISHYTVNITGFFDSPALKYIHACGQVSIIVFFTVSGFVIPWWLQHAQYRINDYGRFVARRMIRIEPPFIIALGLAILYTYVRTLSPYYNGVETVPSWKQVLLQLGYLVPFVKGAQWVRGAYWTLAVECQWYLLMGLAFPLFFNKRMWVRILMYVLVFVGVKLIGVYLFQYFPSLLVGTLLCSYMTNTIGRNEYILATFGIFLFFLFDHADPLVILGSFLIIPMLLFFSDYKNKYLTFFGNMSYSIYLMHSLTGVALVNYFSHTVHNTAGKIVVVAGGIVFTVISAYIYYLLVERPSHKLSLKILVNEHEKKSNPRTKGNV